MGLNMAQQGLRHALARARGNKLALELRRSRLEAQLTEHQAALAAAVEAISKAEEEVQTLQAALTSVFSDTADEVEARQTFPKKHITSWGNLTRQVLATFRSANGQPLWKSEVAVHLQAQIGLVFDTPQEESAFRRQIQRTLKNMCRYGYLERLHDPAVGKEGLWRLKVSPE